MSLKRIMDCAAAMKGSIAEQLALLANTLGLELIKSS